MMSGQKSYIKKQARTRELLITVLCKPPDLIFKTIDGWFFYDEVWADCHGPYESKEAANEACRDYAETL